MFITDQIKLQQKVNLVITTDVSFLCLDKDADNNS